MVTIIARCQLSVVNYYQLVIQSVIIPVELNLVFVMFTWLRSWHSRSLAFQQLFMKETPFRGDTALTKRPRPSTIQQLVAIDQFYFWFYSALLLVLLVAISAQLVVILFCSL